MSWRINTKHSQEVMGHLALCYPRNKLDLRKQEMNILRYRGIQQRHHRDIASYSGFSSKTWDTTATGEISRKTERKWGTSWKELSPHSFSPLLCATPLTGQSFWSQSAASTGLTPWSMRFLCVSLMSVAPERELVVLCKFLGGSLIDWEMP